MRAYRSIILIFLLLFLALFIVAKYVEKQHEKELLKQVPSIELKELKYEDLQGKG